MLPVLFAPLQGVTDHVFRKAYEAVFAGVEEYYTPFIRWEHGSLRNKDAKELAVLAEEPKTVVQLLPANRDQAVCLANEVRAKGLSFPEDSTCRCRCRLTGKSAACQRGFERGQRIS